MSYYLRKGIHIHIENWDIEDSNDCSVDYLSIEDSAVINKKLTTTILNNNVNFFLFVLAIWDGL